jgi:carbonic anhydrase
MSRIPEEILQANSDYAAAFGERGRIPARPARGVAILTCMDARLDPAGFAGFKPGDAHVIRNAGGRASEDAVRSLVLSHTLLGTREWLVVHHTDCGMEKISENELRALLAKAGAASAADYAWMTIQDYRESVLADVERIRSHPLVTPGFPVHGFLYDVKTGRLEAVRPEERAGQKKGRRKTSAP